MPIITSTIRAQNVIIHWHLEKSASGSSLELSMIGIYSVHAFVLYMGAGRDAISFKKGAPRLTKHFGP